MSDTGSGPEDSTEEKNKKHKAQSLSSCRLLSRDGSVGR